jgi:hypothetical protein
MQTKAVVLSLVLVLLFHVSVAAQGGRGSGASNVKHIVYGDIKVAQAPVLTTNRCRWTYCSLTNTAIR